MDLAGPEPHILAGRIVRFFFAVTRLGAFTGALFVGGGQPPPNRRRLAAENLGNLRQFSVNGLDRAGSIASICAGPVVEALMPTRAEIARIGAIWSDNPGYDKPD